MAAEIHSRVEAEKEFYDRYSRQLEPQTINPLEVFSRHTDETQYLFENFGNVRGSRILDLGCGQGDTSVFFALSGAEVWGIDVSQGMIQLTEDLARRYAVGDRVHPSVMRAEKLGFGDDMFDLIFADGVLHHINLEESLPELVRVLKRGGKAVFVEPQQGNALMDVYRFLARDLRTPGEKPIGREEYKLLEKSFKNLEHREYHLFTLPLFALRFAHLRLQGRAYPYWMEEVRQGKYLKSIYRFLQSIDRMLLAKLSALRKWCWLTVIVGSK